MPKPQQKVPAFELPKPNPHPWYAPPPLSYHVPSETPLASYCIQEASYREPTSFGPPPLKQFYAGLTGSIRVGGTRSPGLSRSGSCTGLLVQVIRSSELEIFLKENVTTTDQEPKQRQRPFRFTKILKAIDDVTYDCYPVVHG